MKSIICQEVTPGGPPLSRKAPLICLTRFYIMHLWRSGAVNEVCWAVMRTLTASRVKGTNRFLTGRHI